MILFKLFSNYFHNHYHYQLYNLLYRSIRLEVHLILKKFSIFMVTYLPTILMNIINQAQTFSTRDRYQKDMTLLL